MMQGRFDYFIVFAEMRTGSNFLETNLNALRLELSADDMAEIARLEQGERIANPDFAPQWD